jgi:hypothetical protein
MHRRDTITRSKLGDSLANFIHNTRMIVALIAGAFRTPILRSFPGSYQLYVRVRLRSNRLLTSLWGYCLQTQS